MAYDRNGKTIYARARKYGTTKEILDIFRKYEKARQAENKPYTMESLYSFMNITKGTWHKYIHTEGPIGDLCHRIKERIQSSLVDVAIMDRNTVAFKVMAAGDKEKYLDVASDTERDKQLEIRFVDATTHEPVEDKTMVVEKGRHYYKESASYKARKAPEECALSKETGKDPKYRKRIQDTVDGKRRRNAKRKAERAKKKDGKGGGKA